MGSECVKLSVLKNVESELELLIERVNGGFRGGKISKVELVSWILTDFGKRAGAEDIERVRADHFDGVAYLESVLEEAKATRRDGRLDGVDFRAMLAPLTRSVEKAGTGEVQKKRGRPAKKTHPE